MAQEKTLTELIDSYTWYDKKNKAQEIFRRLQAGLGGQITTQEDGVNVNENTTLLNFTGGGVNLTDLGEGSVEINIESSGSSPQNLQSVTDVGNTSTNSIILQSTLYDGSYNNSFINFTQKLSQGGGTIISPLILIRDLNSNIYSLQRKQEANTTQGFGFGNGTNWDFYINRLTGSVEFNKYGLGNITGTPVYNLGIDVNGKVVETPLIESGDFIPLSGTEIGSPVTGDIEFDNEITFQNRLHSGDAEILFDNDNDLFVLSKGAAFIRFDVGGVNIFSNQGAYNASVNLYETGLTISSDDPASKGIIGDIYYGANYDDNTYVQKKYVDDNFLQGLEIYSESGTLGGGDGVAIIGDLDFSAGFTGSGIYYNQDMAGQSLAALSADIVAIMMTNNPGQTMVINDPSNSDNVELSLNGKEVGIGAASNRLTLQKFSTYPASSVHYINYSSVSTVSRTWSLPDATGTIALTEDLESLLPIETANTGTVISLTTSGGNLCNFGSANANTTYTTTGTVLNAYAKVLINTTSEPTVTGATKIVGATWVTGTDMYMVVNYTGAARGVEYYFLEI